MKRETRASFPPSDWILLGFVFWFGSGVYLYLFTQGGPKPLYSYILLLGFVFGCIMARVGLNIPLLNKHDKLFRGFIIWLVSYLFFVMVIFLYSSQSEVAVQRLVTAIESLLIAGSFSYLMKNSRALYKVSAVMAFLALLAVVTNFWDLVNPTFSDSLGRAAGLYINPNQAGYYIALGGVAGLIVVPQKLRFIYISVCGIGVFLTFSRSALLMMVVAAIGLWWQDQLGLKNNRFLLVMVCLVLSGGIVVTFSLGNMDNFFAILDNQPHLQSELLSRLNISNNLTEDIRWDLILYSLNAFSDAPIFGHGLGYTDEWSMTYRPHNMYLMFLVEGGVLGGGLYMALMLLMLFSSTGIERVVVVQIIIGSIFSDNFLDSPVILLIIAYVIARGSIKDSTIHRKANSRN